LVGLQISSVFGFGFGLPLTWVRCTIFFTF
jgi:hypothetical protein